MGMSAIERMRAMKNGTNINESVQHAEIVEEVTYQEPIRDSREYRSDVDRREPVRDEYRPREERRHPNEDLYGGYREDPRRYDDYPIDDRRQQMSPREVNTRYQRNDYREVKRPVEPEVMSEADYRRNYVPAGHRRLEVDNVPSSTALAYSKPDRFGLQVLGLNSSENVRIIKPAVLSVEPFILQNVIDSTGRVSRKLMALMDRLGLTVLPLRECGISESITSIEGFNIVEFKGKKYASYCGNDYPITQRDKLFNKITEKLSCGLIFGLDEDIENNLGTYIWRKEESRLSRFVEIGGKEVEVPLLCVSEMEYIAGRLQLHNCNILEVKGDFAHIIVGIDLEGLDLYEENDRL